MGYWPFLITKTSEALSFWCTFKDWTSHNVYPQVLGSYYEF
jgi:hypothetical protein